MNNHVLIEPVKHESFISSMNEAYEEIGTVIEVSPEVEAMLLEKGYDRGWLKGKRVYFDSWLAAKYPKEGTDDHYWLVQWPDVRAVNYDE